MRGPMRKRACKVDELFLPRGETRAPLAQRLVETMRQGVDEVEDVDLFCRALHVGIRDRLRAQADVLGNRSGEEKWVLQHDPEVLAQCSQLMPTHVNAINQHLAALHIVEAHHQRDDGGLARPGMAHDGRRLVRLDSK